MRRRLGILLGALILLGGGIAVAAPAASAATTNCGAYQTYTFSRGGVGFGWGVKPCLNAVAGPGSGQTTVTGYGNASFGNNGTVLTCDMAVTLYLNSSPVPTAHRDCLSSAQSNTGFTGFADAPALCGYPSQASAIQVTVGVSETVSVNGTHYVIVSPNQSATYYC